MNKQELLGALDSDVKDVLYVEFDSIPEALRDTEVAIKWIQTSSPQAFSRTANVLEQIPKHLVNDEVRRAAVNHDISALRYIHPDETDIYLELVLKVTGSSIFGYKYVHESFQTQATVEAIIENCHFHLTMSPLQEWVRPFLTQEMIDQVGATSYRFAISIGFEKMSWSSLKALLINSSDYYEDLVLRGKSHLLVKMVQDGGWPAMIGGEKCYKPRGLFELAGLITQYNGEGAQYRLYCALLQTFPINFAIKVMKTPAQQKILLSLYPHDDLLAYAKTLTNSRALRGMLIEDALGL